MKDSFHSLRKGTWKEKLPPPSEELTPPRQDAVVSRQQHSEDHTFTVPPRNNNLQQGDLSFQLVLPFPSETSHPVNVENQHVLGKWNMRVTTSNPKAPLLSGSERSWALWSFIFDREAGIIHYKKPQTSKMQATEVATTMYDTGMEENGGVINLTFCNIGFISTEDPVFAFELIDVYNSYIIRVQSEQELRGTTNMLAEEIYHLRRRTFKKISSSPPTKTEEYNFTSDFPLEDDDDQCKSSTKKVNEKDHSQASSKEDGENPPLLYEKPKKSVFITNAESTHGKSSKDLEEYLNLIAESDLYLKELENEIESLKNASDPESPLTAQDANPGTNGSGKNTLMVTSPRNITLTLLPSTTATTELASSSSRPLHWKTSLKSSSRKNSHGTRMGSVGILKEGIVKIAVEKKIFVGRTWRDCMLVLRNDGYLTYYHSRQDFVRDKDPLGSIFLLLAAVRFREKDLRGSNDNCIYNKAHANGESSIHSGNELFCFEVITNSTNYLFSSDSVKSAENWVRAIAMKKDAVMNSALRNSLTPSKESLGILKEGLLDISRAKEIEKSKAALIQVIEDVGCDNHECCECGARAPRWVLLKIGCFVCLDCCGVARGIFELGEVKAKSVTLDRWSDEEIDFVKQWGNRRARQVWEATLPVGFKRPRTQEEREKFMREKYSLALYKVK